MRLIIDVPDNETFVGWYTHNDGVNQYHKAKTLGEPNYILLPDNATVCDIEQIRKEIQYEADNIADITEMKAYYRILQIIDKHTGGADGQN